MTTYKARAVTGSDGRQLSCMSELRTGLVGHDDSHGNVGHIDWELVKTVRLGSLLVKPPLEVLILVKLVESLGGNLHSKVLLYKHGDFSRLWEYKRYCIIRCNRKHAIYKYTYEGLLKLNRLPKK